MERTQCYRIINEACKETGFDYKVGTHTLRKTFGYYHYKKFIDVAVFQIIFENLSGSKSKINEISDADVLFDIWE